jgi:hypothetical protein|tara:strand:- start:1002 stop:1256 length:255 start_codon:yes stop_codon:yes gene_type:complete
MSKPLPRLPYEIICKILYEHKGLQTPTARIINERLDEWKEHKEDMEDLLEQAHIHVDEVYIMSWPYFAMNYSKSIYKVLFIYSP